MINVQRQALWAVIIATLVEVSFFGFVLPRIGNPKEPACHDAIYVYPLSPTEDEDPRVDFPSKKMKFVCPHSQQRLEVLGHGGFTCKCDSYHREP